MSDWSRTVDQPSGERRVSWIASAGEITKARGLTIGHVEFLCHSEFIDAVDRHHWVSLIFVTRDTTGQPSLTEPDKLSAIDWFDLDKLPEPISAFAKDALAALK